MINGPEQEVRLPLPIDQQVESRPAEYIVPGPEPIGLKNPYSTTREDFLLKAKPRIVLDGTDSVAPLLGYAGLSRAADQMGNPLENYHKLSKARYEAYCIKGHEVGLTGLITTTADEMIRDVIDHARSIERATGRRPVGCGHSMGSLVIFAAILKNHEENPHDPLFSGLVISSPAFKVSSVLNMLGLIGGQALKMVLPIPRLWNNLFTTTDSEIEQITDIPPSDRMISKALDSLTKLHRRLYPAFEPSTEAKIIIDKRAKLTPGIVDASAKINKIPVPTCFEFKRLQKLAPQAIPLINVPTLFVLSRDDSIVNPLVALKLFKEIKTPHKDSIVLRGTHSLMNDILNNDPNLGAVPAFSFQVLIDNWLNDHQDHFRAIDDAANLAKTAGPDQPFDLANYTLPPAAPPMNLKRLKELIDAQRGGEHYQGVLQSIQEKFERSYGVVR